MSVLVFSAADKNKNDLKTWLAEQKIDAQTQIFINLKNAAGLKYNKVNLSQNQAVLLLPEGKRNRLFEFASGITAPEMDANGMILSPELAAKLAADSANLKTTADHVRWLRSHASLVYTQVSGKASATKPSAINGFKSSCGALLSTYKTAAVTNKWKVVFAALALLLLIAMPMLSRNTGLTGDEILQNEYGKIIYQYYTGDNTIDTQALKDNRFGPEFIKKAKEVGSKLATIEDTDRYMHLYGSSFDTICNVFIDWFGIENVYDFRHKINAFFGFLVMLFGALIIKRLTGSWFWASLGLVLLFFTPRLLGESYNNPKDIPFAAGYTMAIYYALVAFNNIRDIRTRGLVGLIISIALAISIRIGGVLVLAIALFYAALKFIDDIGFKNFVSLKWTGVNKPLITVLVVAVCSYYLGILLWPWGLSAPLKNPINALTAFSNYSGSIRQMFEGVLYDSDLLPRHYLVKYIWITLPLVSLLGVFVFAAMATINKKMPLAVFIVLFAGVFPVFYIYLQKSNVYGGLRHILFVLPQLIALAVMGYYWLATWINKKAAGKGKWVALLPAALALLPAKFIAQNHPLEYIYFNETVGGTAGAYGKYEMDYYLAGLRQSTEWFLENIARKEPSKKFSIVTYDPGIVKTYCKNDTNVRVGFARYDDRGGMAWDYSIFYNAYMDGKRLLSGMYPPKNTVYSPIVDGKPVGVVIKRISTDDIAANRFMNANIPDSALLYFEKYLKQDPNNNEVLFKMASCYLMKNDLPKMEKYGNMALKIYPEYHLAMYLMAQGYMNAQKYDKSITYLNKVLETRPKEAQAFYMLSVAKANTSNVQEALEDIKKAIEISPMQNEYFQVAAQLLNAAGNSADAQRYQKAIQDVYTRDEIYLELSGKHIQGMEEQ